MSGSKSTGGLASLASSFGVNLGSGGAGTEALFPTLYPELMNSVDFKTSLFHVPVTIEGDKEEGEPDRTMSYYEYLKDEQKSPWWSAAIGGTIKFIVGLFKDAKAKEDKVDIVLIDTAGRLQNKVNLMKELEKINKVIENHIEGAPQETLLVIDASTGQNGIMQAKAFKEITNITGIVLTKLDGTAKGGIVLAIKEEVNLPVKFIGLGEKMEDLKPFDIENYIYGLFKDMM